MSMRRVWLWVAGMGTAVLLGCPSGTPVSTNQFPNFSVILRNTASGGDPVSIFAEDESSGAGGLLAPGGQRGYLVENECPPLCSARFTAIRGAGTPNEIRATVTCLWAGPPPANEQVWWNGTSLECVGWSGRVVIWNLTGVTGSAEGIFLDQSATANGTLTFNVPASVQEGDNVTVSATFTGTVTALPGWEGIQTNITVGIVDRGVPGLVVNNSRLLERAFPAATGSITVTGAWTIPANPTTLSIEAGGGFTIAGSPANLVATYSREN
jgi:hypothetical protein